MHMWVKVSMNPPLKWTPNEADYQFHPLPPCSPCVAYFRQAFLSTRAKPILLLLRESLLFPVDEDDHD